MNTRDSVLGGALLFYPCSSPTLPLIFYRGGGKMCKIRPQVLTSLAFEPLAFRNGAKYLKSDINSMSADDGPMSCSALMNSAHSALRTVREFGPH